MGFNRESLYIKGYWEERRREKKEGTKGGRKKRREVGREVRKKGGKEGGKEWGWEERGERQETEKINNRNRPCKRSPSHSSE